MEEFKGKTLAVFGDSIMFGSGNNGKGVGEYLAEEYGFDLHKYCVGGARVGFYPGKHWVVEQIKQAIADDMLFDYIIFDGFTNDCNMTDGEHCDVPLGETRPERTPYDVFAITKKDDFSKCFESIVCAFANYFPNAKTLFIRPHKMGRRDARAQLEYGDRAAEICAKWNISVADLYNNSDLDTFDEQMRDLYTNDSYGWGRGDCTHPNAEGYTKKYMPLIKEALLKL